MDNTISNPRRFYVSLPNTMGIGGRNESIHITMVGALGGTPLPTKRLYALVELDVDNDVIATRDAFAPIRNAPGYAPPSTSPGYIAFVADALQAVQRIFYPSAESCMVVGFCEGSVYFKHDGSLPTALLGRMQRREQFPINRINRIAAVELYGYRFYPKNGLPLPLMDEGHRQRALSIMTVESNPKDHGLYSPTWAHTIPKIHKTVTIDSALIDGIPDGIEFRVEFAGHAGILTATDKVTGEMVYLDCAMEILISVIRRLAQLLTEDGTEIGVIFGMLNFHYATINGVVTITDIDTRVQLFGKDQMPSRRSTEGEPHTPGPDHMNVPSIILKPESYGSLDSTHLAHGRFSRVDQSSQPQPLAAPSYELAEDGSGVPVSLGVDRYNTLEDAHHVFEDMIKRAAPERAADIEAAVAGWLDGETAMGPLEERYGRIVFRLVQLEALYRVKPESAKFVVIGQDALSSNLDLTDPKDRKIVSDLTSRLSAADTEKNYKKSVKRAVKSLLKGDETRVTFTHVDYMSYFFGNPEGTGKKHDKADRAEAIVDTVVNQGVTVTIRSLKNLTDKEKALIQTEIQHRNLAK